MFPWYAAIKKDIYEELLMMWECPYNMVLNENTG